MTCSRTVVILHHNTLKKVSGCQGLFVTNVFSGMLSMGLL